MKRIGWITAAGISLLLLAACGTNNGLPVLPPETTATADSQAVTTAQTGVSTIPETKEAEAVTEPAPKAETTAVQTEASAEAAEPTEPAEAEAPTPSANPAEPAPAARTESSKQTQPPRSSEPAKTTEPPKATEPKATDPPKTSEPPKPTDNPTPTEPSKPPEASAPSESPALYEEPTDAPTEPPKQAINTSELEAYGNQYAVSLGFQIDYSMTTGNSGYFPPQSYSISSMDVGKQMAKDQVRLTYDSLMAYVGNIDGARCRLVVTDNGNGRYTFTALYG